MINSTKRFYQINKNPDGQVCHALTLLVAHVGATNFSRKTFHKN